MSTCLASDVYIDNKKANYGTFSLIYRGAHIRNILPIELKSLQGYNFFKRSAKAYRYVQNQSISQ